MARKVKCPECGTFNDKENAIYHNSKYYCKICYDNKMRESQDYKDLIPYIRNRCSDRLDVETNKRLQRAVPLHV